MIVALVVLLCLAACLLWCLRRPSVRACLWLSAFSGLWLVANNGIVEGAVLITLNDSHGLTTSDLLGYGGAAVSMLRAAGVDRSSRTAWQRVLSAGLCAGIFLLGLALSYFYQPV